MDRWFAPVRRREIRRDLRSYVRSSAQGRRDLLAAAGALGSFARPALIAWAREDKLMPIAHGTPPRRAAAAGPPGRDSMTATR